MSRTEIAERELSGVLAAIGVELRAAVQKHASLSSAYEAYAVILEGLDEFWDEVKLKREQRNPDQMRRELIQTAAMCARAIIDLGL